MRMEFIDPGLLRHELVLEEPETTPDGAGGHAEAWREAATLFARIEPQAARQIAGADQRLNTVTHRITMRRRDGVSSGMRLRKASRTFAIVTVYDPDETGRYLVCSVREDGR